MNLCSDTSISAKKQIGAILKDKFFFIVIQIFRVASLSTLASNDIADSSVSLLSLLSSAVVSYQRVFLQPF